ncbi:hypothetical protein HDE_07831 [Halotydeus destructor]|nr:hypothetical protein HDE_07831 [Halotydeus destructor]
MNLENRKESPLGQLVYDLSLTPIRNLNWTEEYTQEADYALQVVRTDAVIDDTIYVGPALYSGSSYIISKTLKYRQDDLDITDVFTKFTHIAWAYLALICCTVTIVCSFIYVAFSSETWTLKKATRSCASAAWKFVEMLTAQHSFLLNHVSTSIALITASMGIFFIVSGYFVNILSCDRVAKQPLPVINSLEAQLSPEFSNIGPSAFTNFYLYQKLIKPQRGSDLYHLADLIKKKGFFIDADREMQETVKSNKKIVILIDDMEDSKRSIISESMFWDLVTKRMLCAVNSSKISGVTVSEPFNEGVLTYFFNNRLPSSVKRYVDYHARTSVEFAVTPERVKEIAIYLMKLLLNHNFGTMRCYKELQDSDLDDMQYQNASIEPYTNTFWLSAYALVISTIVLVTESIFGLFSTCKAFGKQWKRRTKSNAAI